MNSHEKRPASLHRHPAAGEYGLLRMDREKQFETTGLKWEN